MNNVHKILMLSLVLLFATSSTSQAAEATNLTWMSLMLGGNTYSDPSSCDATHLDLCDTEPTCTGAGGFWYNEACNSDPSPSSCDATHLDLCNTYSTCAGAGAYWYNDTCNIEVGTVTSAGQVWMDRNLGASRIAESSTDTEAYGDLYQWGRSTDGHEKRTSDTTSDLSTGDIPGHDQFITNDDDATFDDWRTPQNNNLWQDVDGIINNPCPSGFRLPTKTELDTEKNSWASTNAAGAFGSPTKLVTAGHRDRLDGSFDEVDDVGYYWSSSVGAMGVTGFLTFSSNGYISNLKVRADGYSVRCLKDPDPID